MGYAFGDAKAHSTLTRVSVSSSGNWILYNKWLPCGRGGSDIDFIVIGRKCNCVRKEKMGVGGGGWDCADFGLLGSLKCTSISRGALAEHPLRQASATCILLTHPVR